MLPLERAYTILSIHLSQKLCLSCTILRHCELTVKVAEFSYPTLIWGALVGVVHWNFTKTFGIRKEASQCFVRFFCMVVLFSHWMEQRLVTDGQTYTIQPQHVPRRAERLAVKKIQ